MTVYLPSGAKVLETQDARVARETAEKCGGHISK